MKKPTPHVHVISWSPEMRLKRPHEVLVSTDRKLFMGEEVPVARFAKRGEAYVFAKALRAAIKKARR